MLQARKDLVHYWCILLRQKVMLIFWISLLFGKAYFSSYELEWNTTSWSMLIRFFGGNAIAEIYRYISDCFL